MELDQIATVAQKYLGIPYCYHGRDFSGLDCIGLASLFYREFNIDIPDNDGADYTPKWYLTDPDRLLNAVLKIGKPAPLTDIRPLDLLYFRFGKSVTHTGIMINCNQFIHIMQGSTVQINHLTGLWRRVLIGARRIVAECN